MDKHYLDKQAVYDKVWTHYVVEKGGPCSVDPCTFHGFFHGERSRSPLGVLDQHELLCGLSEDDRLGDYVLIRSPRLALEIIYDRRQDIFEQILRPFMPQIEERSPESDLLGDPEYAFLSDLEAAHDDAVQVARTIFDSITPTSDSPSLASLFTKQMSENLINLANDHRLRYR